MSSSLQSVGHLAIWLSKRSKTGSYDEREAVKGDPRRCAKVSEEDRWTAPASVRRLARSDV